MRMGVIGTGSWGTALVKVLNKKGILVKWYFHDEQALNYLLKHHANPNHFPDVKFNLDYLILTNENQSIFEDCEVILLACPSAYLPFNLQNIHKHHFQNKFVISAIKGFIGEKALFVSEYLEQEFGVTPAQFAVLSGPSHAEEVVQQKITFLQWGSLQNFNNYSHYFESDYFQVRNTNDYLGLQLAGILKNVYAISLGIVKGLNYGDNFRAALCTASSKETMQIFQSLHYPVDDFLQYGYLGDLLVTAYSSHSRNRNLGIGIGQGKSIKTIFKELNTIPEGFFTIQKLPQKLNIHDFPILHFTKCCLDNPTLSPSYLTDLLKHL